KIWKIILTKPAEKVYDKANKETQKRFDGGFEELEKNPLYGNSIKKLTGKLTGLYRYRIGDWRVIYRISKQKTIAEIIAILPRGDAY
ncbi:MAG: type II toxin-antitoxin system RelE/ParE family toxin, partial [Deltaproteobacteria bacterium]|nr:type II toxin-antitoxin system RelE/ParE family toxin [Deltaproteobacteria bacterium]